MAKRELSHTLKNLKFMQRATQRDENTKKEEDVLPAGDFPSSSVVRRCVVVVEGDPHPGVTKGRMSFKPSIDKPNDEAPDHSETGSAARNSGRKNETTPIRENGSAQYRPEKMESVDSSSVGYGDCKRKQAEVASGAQHPKRPRIFDQENHISTPSNCRSSQKQHKRERLDWSVLRPPRYQSKNR